MAYKIVSIDIDDTLLTSDRRITPAVKEAIQQAVAQGVKIVITTGRPLPGVQNILQELELSGDDQYVITYNGGLIQTLTGKVVLQTPLELADFDAIDAFAKSQNVYVQGESIDGAVTTHHNIHYWASFENGLVKLPLQVYENEIDRNLTVIKAIMNAEKAELDKVQAAVPASISDHVNVIRSTGQNLEFVHQQVSKGNALLELAKQLGVDQSETMAIGDQENDLSMIQAAGLGVAMDNAIDRLKEAAGFITTSNNEDGVAVALKQHVLGE